MFDYNGAGDGFGLAAIRADGSDFHLLGIDGFLPAVSPDGASLLYLAGSPEGDESLVLRDLPSGQTRTIVHVSVDPTSGGLSRAACDASELRVFDTPTASFDPCSTGTKLVETGISQSGNEASNPSWGPTNLVVYDDGADIWTIPASGGGKTNLTSAVTSDGKSAADPVWAPGCANLP